MKFIRNCYFLEDIALMKLSTQLCHYCDSLKRAILGFQIFKYYDVFYCLNENYNAASKRDWEVMIETQAKFVCERFKLSHLETKLVACIQTIAFQWLTWIQRQQISIGLSWQLCSNFIMPDDWNVQGKLNGRKVAKRLVLDKSIDVNQRYKIACMYCLEYSIQNLWKQMSANQKEKYSVFRIPFENEIDILVTWWSCELTKTGGKIASQHFWQHGLFKAIDTGIIESVVYFYNKFEANEIINQAAIYVLEIWIIVKNKEIGINSDYYQIRSPPALHYIRILCFLLSNMTEEQQISFFKEAFETEYYSCVLDCFLQWPNQDFFLPTITQLWDILPETVYGKQIMSVANMYTNNCSDYRNLNSYNYRSLLLTLWDLTPTHYKIYLFSASSEYICCKLLLNLLLKEPFDTDAIEVIRHIFKQATNSEKEEFFIFEQLFDEICLLKGIKGFTYIILEYFSENIAQDFKERFILSDKGRELCFSAICSDDEETVEKLLDWCMLSTEKIEFKHTLIFEGKTMFVIANLILDDDMNTIENIINWGLPDVEIQHQFKETFAFTEGMNICIFLLDKLKWEQLEIFLTWSFSTEEAIEQFKQKLISLHGIEIHYHFMTEGRWQEAELFFEWCTLSEEAIKKLKTDTLFSDNCVSDVVKILSNSDYDAQHLRNGGKWESVSLYLRWGLFDKKTVLTFKEKILQVQTEIGNSIIEKNLKIFEEIIQERISQLMGNKF